MTDSETDRYEYSVNSITEDCSYLGMRNLMGGVEFTMDLYNTDFFINAPKTNPVCLDGVDFMTRGIESYNRMYEDQMGLFEFSSGGFDSFGNMLSFRLVKDNNAVFNKGTSTECVYFLNRANSKQPKINIYCNPNNSEKKEVEPLFDLYVLYKTTDTHYYMVFYCVEKFLDFINKYENMWYYGWVKAEDIILNNKKWYEE